MIRDRLGFPDVSHDKRLEGMDVRRPATCLSGLAPHDLMSATSARRWPIAQQVIVEAVKAHPGAHPPKPRRRTSSIEGIMLAGGGRVPVDRDVVRAVNRHPHPRGQDLLHLCVGECCGQLLRIQATGRFSVAHCSAALSYDAMPVRASASLQPWVGWFVFRSWPWGCLLLALGCG